MTRPQTSGPSVPPGTGPPGTGPAGTPPTDRPRRRRRGWLITGAVVLLLAVLAVIFGPMIYRSWTESRQPDALTLPAVPASSSAAPPSSAPAGTSAAAPTSGSAAGSAPASAASTEAAAPAAGAADGSWTVGPNSAAGYVVDEVLRGEDVTVRGRTSEVSGSMTVAGGAVTAAEVVVDLASVATDSGARDGQFRDSVMEVATYPTATFTLTEPLPADATPADGQTTSTQASGEMTIHGVTQAVTVTLNAQRSGDTIAVQGAVPVTFADYGIEAPDLGFVSVEDAGQIEFLVEFTPAS